MRGWMMDCPPVFRSRELRKSLVHQKPHTRGYATRTRRRSVEAGGGIEPPYTGFANPRITTLLPSRTACEAVV